MSALTRGEKQNKKFMEIYDKKINEGMKPQRALREAREEATQLKLTTESKW